MITKMTATNFACWKCGNWLWKLNPAVHGWSYHCQTCQHLTSPQHELKKAMANKPDGSVGIVAAVPCQIIQESP